MFLYSESNNRKGRCSQACEKQTIGGTHYINLLVVSGVDMEENQSPLTRVIDLLRYGGGRQEKDRVYFCKLVNFHSNGEQLSV